MIMKAQPARVFLLLVCSIGPAWPAYAADPPPVGFETREFTDASRSNWQNTGRRPLSTVIWYPAAAGAPLSVPQVGDPAWRPYFVQREFAVAGALSQQAPRYPIVLLSHGSTSVNLSLGWLGAYLAEHGYIAAAVNHHGNTGAEGRPIAQGFMAPWERAADLSALLDQMLADPKFGAHIDQSRVFAAGHSAGGSTVIIIAGGQFSGEEIAKFCASPTTARDSSCEPRELIEKSIAEIEQLRTHDQAVQESLARAKRSYRDERIRAVVAMAPAVGPAFTDATLHAIATPVFIVTAKEDAVTPPATNALRYARLIPDARLLTVPGNANHFTFGSECTEEGRRKLEPCRDGEGTDRAEVHELVAQRVLKFFETAFYQK
jgi:predicted dienelactone hydrolase